MNRTKMAPLLALLCITGLEAQQPAEPKTKVVFVCEHGAAKSVIAAAEFERMAKQRGLAVSVIARGTNIDPELAPGVVKGLRADGLTSSLAKPVKAEAKDFADAARIVSFGPDLATMLPKGKQALDWSAAPSPGKDYQAARDYIKEQLATLLSQLETEAKPK